MHNIRHLFFIIIGLLASCLCYGQSDSEIIKTLSYYQVKDNRLTMTNTTTLQINDRMGDREARVSISYTKGDKLSINEAWIEDLDGNVIRKIKSKDIEDRSYISDASLYEEDFIKTFDLKHNVYPYRVVYSYSIAFKRFMRIVSFNSEGSGTPINSGLLCVEVPSDYPIAYIQENIDPPVIESLAGTTKYCWNYEYADPISIREKNYSVNQFSAPFLEVVPINFKYGVDGSLDSWNNFGNWLYRLNKGKGKLPFPEEQKIDQLLDGVVSDRQKAEILYKYLQQNNRYINVSIDLGGFQTYPASYVVANRYGDCKALTNYMKSMLQYAGIKSYYTLIKAGDKVKDINHDHVSQVFNHAILTVPFENDTVFLECTSKDSPFGYLGTFTQGREALIIDSVTCKFINTPTLTIDEVLCSRRIDVDLATSMVSLSAVERGPQYEQSSYLANNTSKNTIDQYIKKNVFTGSFELQEFELQTENNEAQITLSATCNMHNPLYKKYGNNIVLTSFPISIPAYESPSNRITDVQLDYPEYYQDTIIYRFGDSFKVKDIPERIYVATKYGIYLVEYKLEEDRLTQYKMVLIAAGRYSLDEYEAFYRFISTIKSDELKNIYLERL